MLNQNAESKKKNKKATHVMQTPNLCSNWSFTEAFQDHPVIYQYVLLDPAPGCFNSILAEMINFKPTFTTFKASGHQWSSSDVSLKALLCSYIYLIPSMCSSLKSGIIRYRLRRRRVELRLLSSRAKRWWKVPATQLMVVLEARNHQEHDRSPAILGKTSSTPRRQKPPNYFGKPIR